MVKASAVVRPLLLAFVGALGTGCVAHRHDVGLGATDTGEVSARQYYVFFGLVEFNELDARRMAGQVTSYTIETKYSFVDLLLSPILLPFTATSRTVTVRT
ncbi:MAG: Bor protein [Planctomycetota bacterium]|jgi:hypothetical protein